MTQRYTFYGDSSRRPADPHRDSPRKPEPYVISDSLREAINLAIYLRRPLLVEGEAGCGKTRLARAVAYELGLPFYPWYIRSSSKAQEGLYSYDALARLHDVQLRQFDLASAAETSTAGQPRRRDPLNSREYILPGPLGQAFALRDRPAVVLIDEIDKADIDFPNDLLSVLDDPWEFKIPEINATVRASHDCLPIVIITSNKEKGNLPLPFLRRCLYYFIDFPDNEERLKAIVEAHFGGQAKSPSGDLVTAAVRRFLSLRADPSLYKKPGTSELLDWITALHHFRPTAPQLLEAASPPPFRELLLKLRVDWQKYAPTP